MTEKQPQRTARETIQDQPELQQPEASRQHDGGEGVIVTRGGADTGKAARKNAEQAVEASDMPASPEQTDPDQS